MRTKIAKLGLACGVAAFVIAPALAQTSANTQRTMPRIVSSRTNQLTATVEDIDQANRRLTLKGPNGNSVQVAVSDDVRNFPQIKKGDQVNVRYFESVALSLRPPGENLAPTGISRAIIRRGPGERPGGVSVSVRNISATVENVDRENREVTLKGPDGNTMQVHVDPSVGNLERIQKGDRITASRTEALAVSVQAPNQKQ